MKNETQLFNKALEIIEILFTSENLHITRSEFNNLIRDDFDSYSDLIKISICTTPKIELKKGRTGGIAYVKGKGRRPELSDIDKKTIKDKISTLLKELDTRTERKAPELKVEKAFEKWLRGQYNSDKHKVIINFRSSARRGKEYQNVDGYLVSTQELKYHLLFKPILTTYEVKAILPSAKDIQQARSYLRFSHYVYLVFQDSRISEEIKSALAINGFEKQHGVGVYVMRDEEKFEQLYDALLTSPLEPDVDDLIGIELLWYDNQSVKQKFQIPAQTPATRLYN